MYAFPHDDLVDILGEITTYNSAGRHFTEVYDSDAIQMLEDFGYIEISRPIHEPSGIFYGSEYWSVKVTDSGVREVQAKLGV